MNNKGCSHFLTTRRATFFCFYYDRRHGIPPSRPSFISVKAMPQMTGVIILLANYDSKGLYPLRESVDSNRPIPVGRFPSADSRRATSSVAKY